VALVALATGVAAFVFGHGYPADVVMLYLLVVVAASLTLGRGPSLAAAVLSVGAFDFFFIPPYGTFSVDDPRHLVTFGVMLLVATVTDHLARRVRDQARAARERERRTTALYEMNRDLGGVVERGELVASAARHIAHVFEGEVIVLWPEGVDLALAVRTGTRELTSEDRGVARWVWTHGEEAGLGAQMFPAAAGLFLPLAASHGPLGVLGLVPRDRARFSDPVERRFLATFAAQVATALERARLSEENARARVETERERLRNALLSSVSHDLRTPLGVIEGAATTLLGEPLDIDAAGRRDLLLTIHEEAESLNRRVRNLLDMTRVEAGALELDVEWQSLEEIVGAALERVERGDAGRRVAVELPAALPLVACDGTLIQQVLVNLLENALKYTPADSPVEISVRERAGEVALSVADRGPGVPKGEEERIFTKFYRATTDRRVGGVGLGLAICRAIVNAHGGRIWAESREGGGAVFRVALPQKDAPPAPAPEGIAE
jgi:two-component system sensor histidine kinase KdpD